MRSFPASQRHSHSEDDIFAKIDRDSATKALMHLSNVKITSMKGHLAGIISKQETEMSTNGPDNSWLAGLAGLTHFPVVLGFYGQEVGAPESIILESPQRWLIVDVRAANGLLQVKGHDASSRRCRYRVSPGNG